MKETKLFQGELPPAPPPPIPKSKHLPDRTVGNRLEQYRKSKDIRAYEFCIHLGISQGSYSDLKNNKSLPSCTTIQKIIRLNEVCIVWLLTGIKK